MYLASYSTPGHVAVDMGVFPSAEVREYAYDGLYSMVYLGRGQPHHVTCTPFTCFCDDEVAKTNRRIEVEFQTGTIVFYVVRRHLLRQSLHSISLPSYYGVILQGMEMVHWIIFGTVVSCWLTSILGSAFSCIPTPAHYSYSALARMDLHSAISDSLHCIDSNKFQLALKSLDIGTDLMLLSYLLIVLQQYAVCKCLQGRNLR